jgi:hypothetical protein
MQTDRDRTPRRHSSREFFETRIVRGVPKPRANGSVSIALSEICSSPSKSANFTRSRGWNKWDACGGNLISLILCSASNCLTCASKCELHLSQRRTPDLTSPNDYDFCHLCCGQHNVCGLQGFLNRGRTLRRRRGCDAPPSITGHSLDLETKRSYEREPSKGEWSGTSDDSRSPRFSGLSTIRAAAICSTSEQVSQQ